MRNFLTQGYNPLPDDKILVLPKLKAFADDSYSKHYSCVSQDKKHCGKSRKCQLPAFSSFPTMFSEAFFSSVSKVVIVW